MYNETNYLPELDFRGDFSPEDSLSQSSEESSSEKKYDWYLSFWN